MYKASLLKAFRRTVEEGRSTFVIVDAPNVRVEDFKPYWDAGQVWTMSYCMNARDLLNHNTLQISAFNSSILSIWEEACLLFWFKCISQSHFTHLAKPMIKCASSSWIWQRAGYEVYVLQAPETDPKVLSLNLRMLCIRLKLPCAYATPMSKLLRHTSLVLCKLSMRLVMN